MHRIRISMQGKYVVGGREVNCAYWANPQPGVAGTKSHGRKIEEYAAIGLSRMA
jgi:hypothetical protein